MYIVSVTTTNVYCISYNHKCILYQSQPQMYIVSVTTINVYCISHKHKCILYQSQP